LQRLGRLPDDVNHQFVVGEHHYVAAFDPQVVAAMASMRDEMRDEIPLICPSLP
jgi:hypothetical protein